MATHSSTDALWAGFLVAEIGASSVNLQCTGLSLVASLGAELRLRSVGSSVVSKHWLSGAWALELRVHGLTSSRGMWALSRTRDQTHVSRVGRRILHH